MKRLLVVTDLRKVIPSPDSPLPVLIWPPLAPSRPRLALEDVEIAGDIRRAYFDCVDALNAKLCDPAAVSARKLLEGLTLAFLEKEKERGVSLAKLLKELPKSEKLVQPLIDLATVVREAGNAAAHFTGVAIDEHKAEMLVRAVEYLLDYLFVVPQGLAELREEARATGEGAAAEDDEDDEDVGDE